MMERVDPTREPAERSTLLAERFVSLADTLVDDFDVVDLMNQLADACVDLLGTDAAGLLLSDPRGHLELVASSSEETRLIELFQLQNEEGPCLDCVAGGVPVEISRMTEARQRWPRFVAAAVELGFVSVYALPMRLRDQTIGGLNLFSTSDPPLSRQDQRVAQALADVATIALLQQRSRHRVSQLAEQLQGALNSRVVVEQAKGVLAEYAGLDMEAAYQALRRYSRDHNAKLSELARDVVQRSVSLDAVVAALRT